jgi:hypothetical protein
LTESSSTSSSSSRLATTNNNRLLQTAPVAQTAMTISHPAAISTIDFIISKRCNVTNTGSFLVRATPWSRSFLKDVLTVETAPRGQ